ncbi:MAG: hypothetical protein AB7O66_09165 [Limisphaerales bacterium]
MESTHRAGLNVPIPFRPDNRVLRYINFRLSALGRPTLQGPIADQADEWTDMVHTLLAHQRETDRLLANYLPPVDWRIQNWLDEYLYDSGTHARLPHDTFVLYRYGVARALSIPPDRDEYRSAILHSYRTKNGVLHNPAKDRRTTEGVFHVADSGLPIPDDKRAVPLLTFSRMLREALNPPPEMLRLPFTASQEQQASCFVSLLLRPVVVPAIPGRSPARTMETRFFAPGSLVANLDFVESIFGNAGDPFLPENDAGLDADHWTGHSGCVILAPHLVTLRKKDLGLPRKDKATERQRRDGMCWESEDELYNGGSAFKLTARDERGVIVTLIADNYFGYCKKEVKTQISYAANLLGMAEEEHAGGALVFASFDLGEEFDGGRHVRPTGHRYEEMVREFASSLDPKPEGYAVDRQYPDILYVPEDARFDLQTQQVSWVPSGGGARQSIRLLPGRTYVRPSGYKVHLERSRYGTWQLVGTRADATLCHKPCTVSGGGKSEISKSISDAIITGPVFVADYVRDFERVEALLHREYSDRFLDPTKKDTRRILSPDRSLGSVIKLLTPSVEDYTPEFNALLEAIPQYVKELVFVIKRFYKPEWGDSWREHFSVDAINGIPGNELKFHDRKIITTQLRVGYQADGSWRTFGLRKDFMPAIKVQYEDDITASVVVPTQQLNSVPPGFAAPSVKFVQNCEYRLFQRPDDAIHRGYDKQTEADFANAGNFFSNYEPLPPKAATGMVENTIEFDQYTPAMQRCIREVAATGSPEWFVCTSNPRLVDGKPSKNPRYLQARPDLMNPRSTYLAEISMRLLRRLPQEQPLPIPVTAVLPGRRNNPPEAGIRPLAVHSPIHYMELPELFMEFTCSMTGKSPSTTGAGSEGALTKGPFNALAPIIDLNNALVAYILCEHSAFITAAGYVGPKYRVDHDISLLVPEVWSRMGFEEATPRHMIAHGLLERCRDFTHEGRTVLASRLGWRINERFLARYFGRVFNHPHLVFTEDMLRPELQDAGVFADGMDNIVATHQRVAESYFADGGIELACPPLKALLGIMRSGSWEGRTLESPEFRRLFTRENLLASDWYADRLKAQRDQDDQLAARHVDALSKFLNRPQYSDEAERLGIAARLERARARLDAARHPDYARSLVGALGRHPRFSPGA